MNECPLQLADCRHCKAPMLRRDCAAHYRVCPRFPVACALCQAVVRRNSLSMHNDRYCPERMVNCPLPLCNQPMRRRDIGTHRRQICPELIVPCTYRKYGCMALVRRRLQSQHMQQAMSEHLRMVEDSHNELENTVDELKEEVAGLDQRMEELGDTEELGGTCDRMCDVEGDVEQLQTEVNQHDDDLDEHEQRLQSLESGLHDAMRLINYLRR